MFETVINIIMLLIVLGAAAFTSYTFAGLFILSIKDKRKARLWQILLSVVFFIIIIGITAFSAYYDQQQKAQKSAALSTRIEEIADNLAASSQELTQIQEELEGRIATVEELKKEAEIAESTISLTEDQVNAIRANLNYELESSSFKSNLTSFGINGFFFLLGLALQPFLRFIKRKRSKDGPEVFQFGGRSYNKAEVEQALKLVDTMYEQRPKFGNRK